MYFAQVLEHGLANFIVFSRAGRTIKSEQEAEEVWEELFSSTMGKQLKKALEEARLDDRLIERLEHALRIRNFLAHDYFRERDREFLTVEGRNGMLAELEEKRAELEATDDELEAITRSLLAARGVSGQTIEEWVTRYRAGEFDLGPPLPGHQSLD